MLRIVLLLTSRPTQFESLACPEKLYHIFKIKLKPLTHS